MNGPRAAADRESLMAGEFRISRRVQFAETDMAGVLYFANYFRLMEEVENAFWQSSGLSGYMLHRDPAVGWPRVAVSCEYLAPARFEDELDVRLRVTHLGTSSVAYEVEFLCRGQRIALGRIKAVCCAMKGGSFVSVDIPPVLREKLLTMVDHAT